MNAATANGNAAIAKAVFGVSDLARLSDEERCQYYLDVCRSVGLNPLTRPFAYLVLDGRMVLYARRDCADQLRKLNGISIEILDKSLSGELLTVHVRARDASGRMDEDLGVVSIGALKGEAAANAALKAVTKAKRRVTLSISGLGLLDETEVEDVKGAERRVETIPTPAPLATASLAPVPQTQTAHILPSRLSPQMSNPQNLSPFEVIPRPIAIPLGHENERHRWVKWSQTFLTTLAITKSMQELDEWEDTNKGVLEQIEAAAPLLSKRLTAQRLSAREKIASSEDTSLSLTSENASLESPDPLSNQSVRSSATQEAPHIPSQQGSASGCG